MTDSLHAAVSTEAPSSAAPSSAAPSTSRERQLSEPCSLNARRILLVEDDPDIAKLLALHLSDAGGRVEQVTDGVDALARVLQEPWDLIILDLGLPGIDGMTIMRHDRKIYPLLLVLMVTARGAEADRVEGLDAGADDYIVKPVSMIELVARVRARWWI